MKTTTRWQTTTSANKYYISVAPHTRVPGIEGFANVTAKILGTTVKMHSQCNRPVSSRNVVLS